MGTLQRRAKGEEGAVLVLVLFFVLGIGLSLTALISLAGTNLAATPQLTSERNIEYSADTAMDGAIQTVRSVAANPAANPTCPNFPSGGSGLVVNPNTESIIVTCSMGTFASGRVVEFAACPAADSTFSSCLANALLVADVEYGDTGCSTGSYGDCTTVTIEDWIVIRANA